MFRRLVLLAAVLWASAPALATDAPLLLREPALSANEIAFAFAGDLWIVGRDGGDARRLTSAPGSERHPRFSPDGALVAFSGDYDGNTDVFVVPAAGGVPKRLTAHPEADVPVAWTPDGRAILFRSTRGIPWGTPRLWTVPVDGGRPTMLPLPIGFEASYAPDGGRLAYVPMIHSQDAWKRYRGGQTYPVWIVDLATLEVVKLPRENTNDRQPMWVGDTVYFLSDRNGPVGLFAYDTKSKQVSQVVPGKGFDIKSASAGPGGIVYEPFGAIRLYDLRTKTSREIPIRVAGDLPEVRPRIQAIDPQGLVSADLSPSGARAVFEARGEIFTVPAEKGDARNLTNTSGAAERDPAWSPDGAWIACLSDASGEYALTLLDPAGKKAAKRIALGAPPSFFYEPTWSPDSKKLVLTDKRLNVWYVEIDKGSLVKIDTDYLEYPVRLTSPAWSPDSKWIAYVKNLPSRFRAVFVYGLADGKVHQITDGLSDALSPAWDRGGEYLYFTTSTDIGPAVSWLDMSSLGRKVSRSVYAVVLKKDTPSPLAPESDEEKPKDEAKKDDDKKKDDEAKKEDDEAKKEETPDVRIDFEGLDQRILALPLPARDYAGIVSGKKGILYVAESMDAVTSDAEAPPGVAIQRFDLDKRKAEKILESVQAFTVSADGEKVLYQTKAGWAIAAASGPAKPGEGSLNLSGLATRLDPKAEWRQMYDEVWRLQRDFFYDPGYHGADLKVLKARYAPFLDGIASRDDLNYLFDEMLGELTVGHMFVRRGDIPRAKIVPGGLLGADWSLENGRYRFARIYEGENWNPDLRAPLTQPGAAVKTGEYLLAVDGVELTAKDDVDLALEGTAGKQVLLKVGADPSGKDAREVKVVPLADESELRYRAWIEGNRRKVDELTGGRVGYVYLPDTGGGGYTFFNRYFYAQEGKAGIVLDERYNGGGLLADWIIDALKRPPMSMVATREGADQRSPGARVAGPKVMITNEFAGSGGDAMPWYFRKARVGPLVGTRTWGGLVGIYDYPPLVDGGLVTAPRAALYGLEGQWEVENRGVAPDAEVLMEPKSCTDGRDPQLEKAVDLVLEALRSTPVEKPIRPPYPDYQKPGWQVPK